MCLRPELQLLRHDGLSSPFGPDAQSRRRILVNRRESIVLSRALVGVWSLLALVIAVGTRAAEPVFFVLFLWCTKCTARVKGFVSYLLPASSFIAVV